MLSMLSYIFEKLPRRPGRWSRRGFGAPNVGGRTKCRPGARSPRRALLRPGRSRVGNPPHRVVRVLGDEKRAVMRHRHPHGPSPDMVVVHHEPREEILILAGGSAVPEENPDHLASRAGRPVPRAVLGGEDVAPVFLGKDRGPRGRRVEGHLERRRMGLQRNVRIDRLAGKLGPFAGMPRVLVVSHVVPGPAIEPSLAHMGDVVRNRSSPRPSRSLTEHHTLPVAGSTARPTALRIPVANVRRVVPFGIGHWRISRGSFRGPSPHRSRGRPPRRGSRRAISSSRPRRRWNRNRRKSTCACRRGKTRRRACCGRRARS